MGTKTTKTTKRTPPPKRPRDPWLLARQIGQIATGEIQDPMKSAPPKSAAAVELGRAGGLKRAAKLSDRKLKQIARKAAKARWGK